MNRVSQWAEFAFVVTVAFGYFIVTSVVTALQPELRAVTHHTDTSLIFLGMIEIVVGATLCTVLWMRGWTPQKVGLAPTFRETIFGVGLAFAAYAAYVAVFILFALLSPDGAMQASQTRVVADGISPATTVLIPWINGFYEELFVTGYVVTALKGAGRSEWFAINASVAIRLIYHLYQGTIGIVGIVPLGLIFAFWYARKGRLWPLIVAHALIDFVGFLAVTRF